MTGSSYERRFALAVGERVTARAFWKGRVAFFALLRALGLGAGDEIVMPGFTCVVVPNAARMLGAVPVYADLEAGGYNIDPTLAEARVTPRTKALLIQHTFGIPAAVDALLEVAARHELMVIEDCAHVIGGTYGGRALGTFGDAAFFSFQWSKPYTTGLGGMAVTSDAAVGARLGRVHEDARLPPLSARLLVGAQYLSYRCLYTPRLAWPAQDLLRAASARGILVGSSSTAELEGDMPVDHEWRMGRSQERRGERLLKTVPARNAHASSLAGRYDERLAAGGWQPARRPGDAVLLRYPLEIANKAGLLDAARRAHVELGSWFESPLHPVPLATHGRFGYTLGECPRAEIAARQLVNLPLHPRVSLREADRIAAFFLAHAAKPA